MTYLPTVPVVIFPTHTVFVVVIFPTYPALPSIARAGHAAVWRRLCDDGVDGDEDAEEGGAPDERDAVYVFPAHQAPPRGREVTIAYYYHAFVR